MVGTQNLVISPVNGLRHSPWKQVNTFITRAHGEGLGFEWQRQKNAGIFLGRWIEPETNTVYQFHGCHWHGHTCLKDRTTRQQKRYKDTCQMDRLIKNNGRDTKYNLVSTWECEEPVLKKVRFEKKLTPYPHLKCMILRHYCHRLMNTLQTT